MDQIRDLSESWLDDRTAAFQAGLAVGRLEESLTQPDSSLFTASFLRREAVALAATEGFAAQEEELARVLQDDTQTFLDRAVRTAHDAHRALAAVFAWGEEGPSAGNLLEILRLSSKSNPRRRDPAQEWKLEDDASVAAQMLDGFRESPDPWKAAGAFRSLWTSPDFAGQGARLAYLLAPWLVRTGFSCSKAVCGLASVVGPRVDAARAASEDSEDWGTYFLESVAESARTAQILLGTVRSLRRTLEASCPAERSTARTPDAIAYLIGNPVTTARALGAALQLTPRGTKSVVDRLLASKVIEPVNDRLRNRIFVCRKALAGRA